MIKSIALAAVVAAAGIAHAGPSTLTLGTDFDVQVTMGPSLTGGYIASNDLGPLTVDTDADDNLDSAFEDTLVFASNAANPSWDFENFDLRVSTNPVISNAFTMRNTLDIDMVFNVIIKLTTTEAFANPEISGGTAVTVLDTNFDGAASVTSVAPSALTQLTFDGGLEQSLLNDPQNVNSFAVENLSPTTGFTPIVIGTEIALINTFRLSAGDTVTFNSTFVIVPAPGGTLALAGVGLAVARRRR